MPSPFSALMAAADESIDGVFGETIRIEPQFAGGDYAVTADPDRLPFECLGVVTYVLDTLRAEGSGKSNSALPRLAGEAVRVSIRASLLGGASIRQKDRLVMLERPGDEALIVHAIEPDDVGRILLRCVRTPL